MNVGQRIRLDAAQEGHPASGQVAGDAAAQKIGLREIAYDAIGAHSLVQGTGLLAQIDRGRGHVILKISAHAGERNTDLDAVLRQFVRIADTGEHEELRRVDHAAGQDHFPPGAHRA